MQQLLIQDVITKSAPFDGAGVSVATVDANAWTLVLEVLHVTGTQPAYRFAFSDSVNGFVAAVDGPTFSGIGTVGDQKSGAQPNVIQKKWQKHDLPDLRIGVGNAELRLSLISLTGDDSPGITYRAWIEYAV